jgi:hypothetical protein
MADSKLQLTAIVSKEEIYEYQQIQCYPTYTFDGHPEGRSGVKAPRVVGITNKSEQTGTGQPATRPVDEPEGGDKPQPEAEGRSR